jgi:hypothetical protein
MILIKCTLKAFKKTFDEALTIFWYSMLVGIGFTAGVMCMFGLSEFL